MNPANEYPNECAQIIEVCRRLYGRNMLAAADGNVSLRVDDTILITPSGLPKAFIDASDIAAVTVDNQILAGNPSGERLMHLAVYNKTEEARAVVHAHPPHAIAWSVAFPEHKELPSTCLSEVILATGSIPIVPYARPGSRHMGAAVGMFLPHYKVMILSRHGGLTWGSDLLEAYMGMERLEHSAEILYKAKTLRELSHLPADEVAALKAMRKEMGNKTL